MAVARQKKPMCFGKLRRYRPLVPKPDQRSFANPYNEHECEKPTGCRQVHIDFATQALSQ